MTERIVREANWSYQDFVLPNSLVAVKGELACIDTSDGEIALGGVSTTLLPIGLFNESVTGDGSKSVTVRLFREGKFFWFANDTDTPVAGSDRGNECYILDGRTVTMDSTGKSKAGRVWAVDSLKGVLVEA